MSNESEYFTEYFIARGRSLVAVLAHFEVLNAHRDAFWALGQAIGATAPVFRGREGYGWRFDGDAAPDVVREDPRNPGVWVTHRKTKAARDLHSAAGKIPPSPRGLVWDFWPRQFLGGIPTGPWGRGGQPISGVGVERLGTDWVIEVPIPYGETAAPVPPDALPLLRSEYWKRKEQAAEYAAAVERRDRMSAP